jgi:hypothetical protein
MCCILFTLMTFFFRTKNKIKMSTSVSNELNKSVSDTFSKVDTDNKLSDTEASEVYFKQNKKKKIFFCFEFFFSLNRQI